MNWHDPDYAGVFRERARKLARLRAAPQLFEALRTHYRQPQHLTQFINDWACTYDPRNAGTGQPALVPFILFPRQEELVRCMMEWWLNRESAVVPKSREVGVTWVAVAVALGIALFHDGAAIGFGSRKEEYVDKVGDPKSIFEKARILLRHLPHELRGGWQEKVHAPHMKIVIPQTGALLTGEAGDNIGRGNRTSLYFVDEATWLERPLGIEAALSETTRCRIDLSSARNNPGPFLQKVTSWPAHRVFYFHWRDDPRKDEAWYAQRKADLPPVVVAQEIDIDFAAAAEGIIIPSAWVQAAVDAHMKLGLAPSGLRACALDVADEGEDTCAWAAAHGWLVEDLQEWSGKGSDLMYSAERAAELTTGYGASVLWYDADGLGAGVKGAGRVVNEKRQVAQRPLVTFEAYRGSAAVARPESEDVKGRKNQDFFLNTKVQTWWSVRARFEHTYRAIEHGDAMDPERIISISSRLPLLSKLAMQLSQPTYGVTAAGKLQVDKMPDGAASPNLADALVMRFNQIKRRLVVPAAAVRRFQAPSHPALRAHARGNLGKALARFQRVRA